MTVAGILLLVMLSIAILFFITEWLRADLVAMLLLVVLGVTGILTPQETLSGFSRSAVITISAIYILTAGLTRTGATHTLGVNLMRLGGRSELRLIVVLMAVGAGLSLFMNNIAAAAVLLPATIGISRERKISPSKLLMPLAFGTLLGGMATLLTTSNILVSAALRDANYPAFGLFDFAPIGGPVALVGIVYMAVLGRRWLPRRAPADWTRLMAASHTQLPEVYGLQERWVKACVPARSPLVNRTLAETGLGEKLGVNLIAIIREGKSRVAPSPNESLRANDVLYLQAREEQIGDLRARGLDIQPEAGNFNPLTTDKLALFEVVLSPRSHATGKTLRALHFRPRQRQRSPRPRLQTLRTARCWQSLRSPPLLPWGRCSL